MSSRGHVLVEWMVAMAIGMTLVMAAVAVFSQQLHALRETVWRQRRERDLQETLEHLRRELRRAGMSLGTARTVEHDAIVVEGSGSSLQAHYRSDAADPSRPVGRSSFRISQRALQWRTPSTGGFQQLSDPQLLPMNGWAVQIRSSSDPCRSLVQITVQIHTQPSVKSRWLADSPLLRSHGLLVRRRNEGGSSCPRS